MVFFLYLISLRLKYRVNTKRRLRFGYLYYQNFTIFVSKNEETHQVYVCLSEIFQNPFKFAAWQCKIRWRSHRNKEILY